MAFDFHRLDTSHLSRGSPHRSCRGGSQLARRTLPGRIPHYTQGWADYMGQRHHDRGVADPYSLPILACNAVFGLEGFAARGGFLRGMNDGVILERDVTYPIGGSRKPFLRGVAEHRFDLRADVEPLALDSEFRDVTYGRHLLDEHAVFRFGFGARTLGAQTLGDVVAHANGAAVGERSDGHFRRDH